MASGADGGNRSRGLADRGFALILLVYLAAIAGFHRDFARLHVTIGVVPLFSGEVAILLLSGILLAGAHRGRRFPWRFSAADWLLLAYMAIGTVFAVVGLIQGYGLAALRDYALVYYAVFYFFTRAYLAGGRDPLGPLWALTIGASAGSLWQVAHFVSTPTLSDGHGAPGCLGLTAWIALVALVHLRGSCGTRLWRLLWWVAAIADLLVIYLSAYRTLVGVVIASFVVLGIGKVAWPRSAARGVLARVAIVLAVSMLAVVAHVALAPALSARLTIHGRVSLTDGLGAISSRWAFRNLWDHVEEPPKPQDTASDQRPARPRVPRLSGGVKPSYVFRARAWRNALDRIGRSPFTGIGFGPPAALFPDELCELPTDPLSNCGNAHNTYLTVAMRMGVPALLLFGVINVLIVWKFLTRLRAADLNPRHQILASVAAVAYVSCLAFASLSLFFESPYLGALFWVVLGCVAAASAENGGETVARVRTRSA